MKSIDKYLASADAALTQFHLVDPRTAIIKDNVYDGYLSGFGPAVITSGMIQTIASYVADDKRKRVMDAIATVAAIDQKLTGEQLLRHCLAQQDKHKLNIWRTRIIDVSIALKMMIRTYAPIKD